MVLNAPERLSLSIVCDGSCSLLDRSTRTIYVLLLPRNPNQNIDTIDSYIRTVVVDISWASLYRSLQAS